MEVQHGDFGAGYHDVKLDGMGPKVVKNHQFFIATENLGENCRISVSNMNHLVIGMWQLVIFLSLLYECTHLVHGEYAVYVGLLWVEYFSFRNLLRNLNDNINSLHTKWVSSKMN